MRSFAGFHRAYGLWVLVMVLGLALPASAQNQFPLELTNIKPVGTPPSGMPSGSRIYRAYPGLVYNIRAAVIGGNYPYTFTLANAPAGMAINAATGEVNWPNPQASATPTITVRDQSGAQVSSTWPITVGTSGFRFIDPNNGADSNGGTLAAPWRTVGQAKAASSATDIWYFRSGTYLVQTSFGPLVNPGTSRYAAQFFQNTTWLAYPGETPILEYGAPSAPNGQYFPTVTMLGSTIYVDGFETRNTQYFFFINVASGQGSTYRRMNMHHQQFGWIESGSNASFLMYEHASPQSYGSVIQDSVFYDGGLGIKHYDLLKPLTADNVFHDLLGGIEEKAGITQFTIRNNNFYNIGRTSATEAAIGGNMNPGTFPVTGEVCFNLVRMQDLIVDEAFNFNQDSGAGRIYAYRNTFVGLVSALFVDSADGPFTLSNNVIVNNESSSNHVLFYQVSAPGQIVFTNNLTGFPNTNIVDQAGNLTAAYAQYIGTRGYQISGGGSQLPQAPTNLRITTP